MTEPRFPNAKRPAIPEARRAEVMARDANQCVYCGAQTRLTLDHIFPFSAGGSSETSNLVVACETDNRLAGDRVFGEFAAKRDWVRRCRTQLGAKRLALIAAALAAGDETGAKGLMADG